MSVPSAAVDNAGWPPVSALAGATRARSAGRLLGWLRERAGTTPGRLVLIGIVLVVSAGVFGAIATSAERSRSHAANAVRNQTEPLLGQAVTLYTSLSDANATATATFLHGGLERPALRARYLADLDTASASLATLSREVGSSPAAISAVAAITGQLPVYAGLVETARANNRQGFPAGAAYLRKAASTLAQTILPAADRLYALEARRLTDGYATGTSGGALIVLVLIAVLVLGELAAAQRYLTKISRRILNVPLVIATVALAAVSIWAVIALVSEQGALVSARHGSDAVEVLSAASVLLSRAQSDQSLTLVNRGSDETDPLDLRAVMGALGGHGGLITELQTLARQDSSSTAVDHLAADFARYRAQVARITTLQTGGDTSLALAAANGNAGTFDGLSSKLSNEIAAAQERFDGDARSATSDLSGLSIAIPVLTVLAAILVIFGIRQRLQEYR